MFQPIASRVPRNHSRRPANPREQTMPRPPEHAGYFALDLSGSCLPCHDSRHSARRHMAAPRHIRQAETLQDELGFNYAGLM